MADNWMYDPFHATFLGVRMYQVWPDLMLWERFFQEHKVQSMIEFGTAQGGLSLYLHLQAQQRKFTFWTYDVTPPNGVFDTVLGKSLERAFIKGDVFQPEVKSLATVAPRPLAILCDGGDKRRELKEFFPLLHSGDFVAVHDWHNEIDIQDVPPSLHMMFRAECEQHQSWTRWFEVM